MSIKKEHLLDSKEKAYKALMPFIKDNAIFIPVNAEQYRLGEQIQVSLKLTELGKSISFRGSIIWQSFDASVSTPGVGVRFEGTEGKKARQLLEDYTKDFSSDTATDTI